MSLSNSHLAIVPKLDGMNYQTWKFAVSMLLRRQSCFAVTTGLKLKATGEGAVDTEWDKLSEEGLTIIGLTIDPSQYGIIRDAKTGYEAWTALKNRYEKDSRATRVALKRRFYLYQHEEDSPIQEYIRGITDAANALKSINVALTDTDITDVLIFNLGDSWSSIAGSLLATKGELTVADVTGTLLEEDGRRRRTAGGELETAMLGRDGKKTRRFVRRADMSEVDCFTVQRSFPLRFQCRRRPRKPRRIPSPFGCRTSGFRHLPFRRNRVLNSLTCT